MGTERPVLARVRDYFQSVSDSLGGEKEASGVFPNRSDAGATREDLLADFLRRHLPTRCRVIKGGFIFDSLGNESRQMDLIVTNDLTLQFGQFGDGHSGKSFNCVEGCYAAIAVKTTLDRDQLRDGYLNLASIPPMPEPALNPSIGPQPRFKELPLKVLFAFDGIEGATISAHLQESLAANAEIPQERRVDLVIVNGKYIISRAGPSGGKTRDGQALAPYSYYAATFEGVGAFSLIVLLTKIQNAANFGTHVMFDFSDYGDALPYGS